MGIFTSRSREKLALATVGLLCSMGVAHSEDLIVMGYGDAAFKDNYMKAVVEPFMAANPDIKVSYFPVLNAGAGLGQLRAQKNDPQADLVILELSIANIAKQEGLIDSFDTAKMANYVHLGKLGRELGDFGLPIGYDTIGFVYSTAAFSQKPTSLSALWQPEFKGKVVISARSDIQATALTVLVNKAEGGTDYINDLEKGYTKLVELAPSVQTWDPKPDQYTLLVNGSAAISTGWNARNQTYTDQTNGKISAFTPSEGTVAITNVISQVKGAKAAEAARKFADFAISVEPQKRFSEATYYSPTNTQVQLPDALKARIPMLDPEIAKQIIPVDWLAMSGKRQDILAIWKRRVIAAGQ